MDQNIEDLQRTMKLFDMHGRKEIVQVLSELLANKIIIPSDILIRKSDSFEMPKIMLSESGIEKVGNVLANARKQIDELLVYKEAKTLKADPELLFHLAEIQDAIRENTRNR